MTIAISLHVNDGIVLASDSAASVWARGPDQKTIGVVNVYNHADKVFNLCKEFPIGAITWGSGSIGNSSISTLLKDFRRQVTPTLDQDAYTIEEVTGLFADFVYSQNYVPAFKDWEQKPDLGFMVGGYSAKKDYAEEWKFDIIGGTITGPYKVRGENETGMTWNGESEAITRLYFGHGAGLPTILSNAGIDKPKLEEIMQLINQHLAVPFVVAPMPIQDAIDIAAFFVNLTVEFSRFKPGAPTVGGPVDIASITKHEGFKWVRRKHYYQSNLNP